MPVSDPKQSSRLSPPASGERPTLKTIAFLTGLGVTTVSRALKDADDIGADTKERVRLVAKQLGYRPNRAGVRLRTGKTNVIALVLGMDAEIMSMTGQMVYGINETLADTQYHLVLTPHMHSTDPMSPVRYIVETGSADGIIISRTEPDDARVRFLIEHGIPFATHGRTDMGIHHPFHDFDNEFFAYNAVSKLVAKGRRKIALLPPPEHLMYGQHSRAGFQRGLKDFGPAHAQVLPITTEDNTMVQKQAVEALMRSADAPDGLICCSGSSAIAAAAGIDAAGSRIGVDIDMATKEAANVLKWFHPEIMSMNENFALAGRELARAVMSSIGGADAQTLQSISRSDWSDKA